MSFEEWWNKQGRLFMAGSDVSVQRAVMGVAERAFHAGGAASPDPISSPRRHEGDGKDGKGTTQEHGGDQTGPQGQDLTRWCPSCPCHSAAHRNTGCACQCHGNPFAIESAAQTVQHAVAERESRNGMWYIHCVCGWNSGPFYDPDNAEDDFDYHTQLKAPIEGTRESRESHALKHQGCVDNPNGDNRCDECKGVSQPPIAAAGSPWIDDLEKAAEAAGDGCKWRSPWLPGSKQLCAGVENGDHYIFLNVDRDGSHHPDTIEMWKRYAGYIAKANPAAILELIKLVRAALPSPGETK